MRVGDFLDTLKVTGKIDNKLIEKIWNKKWNNDAILSDKALSILRYSIKKFNLEDIVLIQLIYALNDDKYVEYLSILKYLNYSESFKKAIERFTGERSILRIYADNDLKFGSIQLKRLGATSIGVIDSNNKLVCKGSVFFVNEDYIYREYNKDYMICIDRNGDINKLKSRYINCVKVASYPFSFKL